MTDCVKIEINLFFFHTFRHGIDLDNPGVGMINSTSANHLPIDFNSGNVSTSGACSDSGESISGNRSESNATPPMHFLTPHVEISMAELTPAESSSFSSTQVSVICNLLLNYSINYIGYILCYCTQSFLTII